jgi:hypothetical protein
LKRIRGSDDVVADYVPFYREFLSIRNVLIFLACILGILVGCILYISMLPAENQQAYGGASVWRYFAISLLMNGGVGVIVALIISSIILRDQRFEVQFDLDRRVKALADNVFAGVLSIDHDADYIKQVRRRVLALPFERSELNVQITMTPIDFDPRDPRKRRYTRLRTEASYVQKNVSHESRTLKVGVLLPNPITRHVKEHVKLHSARVGLFTLSEEAVNRINAEAQKRLADNTVPEVSFDIHSLEVTPGQEISVDLQYSVVKEEEDNEIVFTSMPTKRINLSVRDSTGRNLTLLAKPIHNAAIYPSHAAVVENGWAEWRIQEWSFPKQGVIFWWKTPQPVLEVRPKDDTALERALPAKAASDEQVQQGPSRETGSSPGRFLGRLKFW